MCIRDRFGILLGVSGVGPRSALGVLSELTPAQVAQAAASEDEKPFRKVSGIGPKTAKLIAVQLAGKLDPRMFSEHHLVGDSTAQGEQLSGQGDPASKLIVTQGLVGLGYAESQAAEAVQDAIAAGAPDDQAGLLRAALALLQTPRLGSMRSSAAVSYTHLDVYKRQAMSSASPKSRARTTRGSKSATS